MPTSLVLPINAPNTSAGRRYGSAIAFALNTRPGRWALRQVNYRDFHAIEFESDGHSFGILVLKSRKKEFVGIVK